MYTISALHHSIFDTCVVKWNNYSCISFKFPLHRASILVAPLSGQKKIIRALSGHPNLGSYVNTLRPRHNGRRFADDTFKGIFLNENARISITISLRSVSMGPINNNPALVQIMAWRRPGDKPLSETMMVSVLTHICVTRPQWVNV